MGTTLFLMAAIELAIALPEKRQVPVEAAEKLGVSGTAIAEAGTTA